MPSVFFNKDEILEVQEEWLSRLKNEAKREPRRRARLCLHMVPEDSIQEMLIVLCNDALVRPHCTLNKTESFHVVEGELRMIMFDDQGNVTRRFDMGPLGSGKPFMARFASSPWYTYKPLSEFIVIHEITRGPFDPSGTAFPVWAPENAPELKAFLERAAEKS